MMKSALSLIPVLIFSLFPSPIMAHTQVEHDAQCVAIYINGVGVANGVRNVADSGGTYPTTLKSGEKFHVEIKMKNTGSRPWLKSQNYKLGKNDDGLQWGQNRIELPNTNPVSTGSEVLFAFDLVNLHNTTSKTQFWWGMMRERTETNTEEGGSQVVDPGGRFGQDCYVYLNVEGSNDKPAVQTPAKTPELPKAPDIKTFTACTDTQKGLQTVKVDWTGYQAPSVKVFLKDTGVTNIAGGSLVDSSSCLGSGTQQFTFPKEVLTDTTYKVSIMPFKDSYCSSLDLNAPTGGYYGDVANGGFVSPKNYTDPSTFHLKNMFIEIGSVRSKFNFESCAPTSYTLPIPSTKTALHSFDTPIKILLTRFAAGTSGTVQRNDINTAYPVIIRYRPVISGSEGETFKAPVPSQPKTNSTDREEVSEP